MGAACVSMLRLPLSSIVIALLLTSSAGIAVGPLIIVAVATAYITTEVLSARLGEASKRTPAEKPAPMPAATPTTRLSIARRDLPRTGRPNHPAPVSRAVASRQNRQRRQPQSH